MKPYRKVISTVLICLAIICIVLAVILVFMRMTKDRQSENKLEQYRVNAEDFTPAPLTPAPTDSEMIETGNSTPLPSDPEADKATPTPLPTPVAVPNPYADAFLANEHMAGWLKIDGTNIDYPIMWTPGDENYYLYRSFDGSEDLNGCLILDTDSSTNPLTTNLIIHGHNMKSGAMFGNLTDYEDKSYYEEHKYITLYTESCERNYEVIAVFRSQVYKKTDNVFKFYKFFQANTEAEFDDFYNNIKELSIYDTGVAAEFGDHFITLSTCVYHVTNGRFVVVAKEIEPGETYIPIER
jgi:sortase B